MRVNVTIEWCHDTKFKLADERTVDSLNPKEMLLYATAECAGITVVLLEGVYVYMYISLF